MSVWLIVCVEEVTVEGRIVISPKKASVTFP